MPDDYQCECGPSCLNHNPQNCNFLKDYKAHLDTLDFQYVLNELERIGNKIQELEGFEEEIRNIFSKSNFFTPELIDKIIDVYQHQKDALDEISRRN